jgi:hypothetical protein
VGILSHEKSFGSHLSATALALSGGSRWLMLFRRRPGWCDLREYHFIGSASTSASTMPKPADELKIDGAGLIPSHLHSIRHQPALGDGSHWLSALAS